MRQVAQSEQTAVPAQTFTASPSGPGCPTSDIQPTTTGTATSSHPNIDHAHTTRSPSAPPADGAVSSSDTDTSGESDSESLVFQDIRRRHPQDQKKQEAENILFGDSTVKYIDNDRYMGRAPSYIQRSSTASVTKTMVEKWTPSDKVKTAVVHAGINDVRARKDSNQITSDIKYCLETMKGKFPGASIGFSELLYIGRENQNVQLNEVVTQVNSKIKEYCQVNGYIYISHNKLKSPSAGALYDDEVHVNRNGGTALLVSDIQRSLRRRPVETSTTNTDGTRVFYNRGLRGAEPKRRPNLRRNFNTNTGGNDARQIDTSSMNDMIAILTLNMLNSMQNRF